MTNIRSASKDIEAACLKYLDTYFVRRDLKATLELFAPHITGFGTGQDEFADDKAGFERLYARDIAQAPNTIEYTIADIHAVQPTPDCGLASIRLDIRTVIAEQELKLNNLRLSLLFVQENKDWLVEHMHISFPTSEHEGDEAYPVKELEERNKVLQRIVNEKTAKLNEAIEEIGRLAVTDKLTGLYNRLKIDELLSSEMHRSQRYFNVFSIILIDVDHFKKINDEHGHLAGDTFLKDIAQLLLSRIRKTDAVGRWGGEEFLILCPETDAQEATDLAEDIRTAVSQTDFGLNRQCTISLGISAFSPGDDQDAIISRADQALYQAKHEGRNLVRVVLDV